MQRTLSLIAVSIVLAVALMLSVGGVIAQEQAPQSPQSAIGTAFTYQGQLKNASGPVTGMCDLAFRLYDAVSVGNQVGNAITSTVPITNGFFTVQLDFGVNAFTGEARWLDIAVRCPAGSGDYVTLTPRQSLTPAPYALALPGLRTQPNSTSPNVIGGYSGNVISPTVVGAVIGGGGAYGGIPNRVWADYATIGGGYYNTASGYAATIGGGSTNTASGERATIGGGSHNTATSYATVGGGVYNTASGFCATVGGGYNTASNQYATVGGGGSNTASGYAATVSGGYMNSASALTATIAGGEYITVTGQAATVAGGSWITATGDYAAVGGGANNIVSGYAAFIGGGGAFDPFGGAPVSNVAQGQYAVIGGGKGISVTGNYATVGGGQWNAASGENSTLAGGERNTANGNDTTVGGGNDNTASGDSATVGGGLGNTASGDRTTVGGGQDNTASGYRATAGGGWSNTASGYVAMVGGGQGNTASGNSATVPGGASNSATMSYSFAAGRRAKANHDGALVWADSTDADFASTANNQFLIRANGGVGINTNQPRTTLEIAKSNESGLGGTLRLSNPAGGSNAQVALDLATTDVLTNAPSARILANDAGNYSADLLFQTKVPGAMGNALQTNMRVRTNGYIAIEYLSTGGSTTLCRNASNDIATCSSSLRYKSNVADLALGLDTIARLRPVTFDWKESGQADLGFVAEEVQQLTPLLTTLNAQGQIEGVKYDRITAVLVKGMQEQQQQIAAQQTEIRDLQARLADRDPNVPAASFNWFNALSVLTLGIVIVMLIQQRRSKRGES